ncbi:unnamed protein product [Psylliodes chrysocephalus]|uniref:Thioredoxin domain-containing protein n=1 Tax=Psylliodes chrysocephalus TaxID=3402493 RepID=A0A9P0CEC5_9CUCU|nr:unnamed protein product [Psylliodes chrysocephala]
MKLVFVLTVLLQILLVHSNLEVIQDEELMNLIRTEKYVIVLFSRKYCESCDNYENELTSLREDLVETLNAWVVKVEDSQMTRLYSPEKEPQLVFFRHGIPLLYNGPLNDELILHTLTTNKEPVSKELTDNTFEHLTQAATGATTGDWFVLFYTPDCVDCTRLQARWEAVGAKIKSRVNIARVNKAGNGAVTARRFDVTGVPSFILFRQGKMYRYNLQKFDINSLSDFAQTMVVMYMKENPWLWQLGFGTFLLGLIASLITKFTRKTVPEKKKSDKKDKKEKSKNK